MKDQFKSVRKVLSASLVATIVATTSVTSVFASTTTSNASKAVAAYVKAGLPKKTADEKTIASLEDSAKKAVAKLSKKDAKLKGSLTKQITAQHNKVVAYEALEDKIEREARYAFNEFQSFENNITSKTTTYDVTTKSNYVLKYVNVVKYSDVKATYLSRLNVAKNRVITKINSGLQVSSFLMNNLTLTYKEGEKVNLPSLVGVNLVNGSKVEKSVVWDATDFSKAGTYTVSGTVAGTTQKATVKVIVVDTSMPVISNVKYYSNNADQTKAMNGDTITVTFTSDEPVEKLSNFKINGSNPDTFTHVGNVYTATHKVDEGDHVGPATFQINVKNEVGLFSQTIENTNDGSSVTIIDQYARISNVKLTSSNVDPTKASIGDTITLTFTSDQAITKLTNFKINGSNPDTFTNEGNVYTVTHKVDAGDVDGAVTFQINVKNEAGIYSPTLEATTDGSAVTITK